MFARYAIAVAALTILLFISGGFLHRAAAADFVPLAPIPGTGGTDAAPCTPGTAGCTTVNLATYLRGLYNSGVALAGLFLVFAIVRGGFSLLFTDSILGHLEGKKIILQALGGAVIVYASYLLLNTINPQLADDLDLSLEIPRPKLVARDNQLLTAYDTVETEVQLLARLEEADTSRMRNARRTAERQYDTVATSYRNLAAQARTGGNTALADSYEQKAKDVEIKALALRTDAFLNDAYNDGLESARRGVPPNRGNEDANLQYARRQVAEIDLMASRNVSGILERGTAENAQSALNEVINISRDQGLQMASLSGTIGQRYAEYGISSMPLTQMQKIDSDTQLIIEKLDQLKGTNPYTDKAAAIDAAIADIKRKAKGEINAVKRKCLFFRNEAGAQDQGLDCRNYQSTL